MAEAEFNDIEFFDESFRLNPGDTYEWEMMEFASAADGGADSNLLSGLAATMNFLHAVIHADDWERFRATARKNRAKVQEHLMPIVVKAFVQPTGRPTGRSSDSSAGPKTTKRKSAGGSSSKVIRREEKSGRPDRALMLVMADEARSARSA